MLELKNITMKFGGVTALSEVNLHVSKGEIAALIGPNGAGKTTLLKLILGTITPDSGTATMGTRIEVAYFDQMRTQLNEEVSLAETISPGDRKSVV